MMKTKIKLTKLFIISICIFIVVAIALAFLQNWNNLSQRDCLETLDLEPKICSKATLYDDFDDSSVIVIMDKSVSGYDMSNSTGFFGDFGIEGIEDLTALSSRIENHGDDPRDYNKVLQIKLQTNSKENVLNFIKDLEKIEGIKCVEPNYFGQTGKVPSSNTRYYNQWGVDGVDGILGIQAREAWDISIGSCDVRVGIIDTGIAPHPDLNANLVEGIDFTGNNSTIDIDGHGTHVAGIVGAIGTNAGSVAGVAWNVSLVPLRVATTSAAGGITTANAINAINYASSQWDIPGERIHILNFSAWGFPNSSALKAAIDDYRGLFVCISGNGNGANINVNEKPNYPGSFNCSSQITVGSVSNNGAVSSFSNIGSTAVDVFAPGDIILSTHTSNGYAYYYGTSMAAPHVAGTAALMLSANPNLTARQIKEAIMDSVNEDLALKGKCITGGRLNAFEALKSVAFDKTQIDENNVRINDFSNHLKGSIAEPFFVPSTFRFRENGIVVDKKVAEIGNDAFAGLECNELVIPKSVISIGDYAFANCKNLKKVHILDNLSSIGKQPFIGCTGLYGFVISNHLSSTQHKKVDIYGELVWELHLYDGCLVDARGHYMECTICGYDEFYYNHYILINQTGHTHTYGCIEDDCLYTRKEPHNNDVFVNSTVKGHIHSCECGIMHLETHKYNGIRCIICGYINHHDRYRLEDLGVMSSICRNNHFTKNCSIHL